MSGQNFREEFQRLVRAIYDSLERESELQRQLRRTKENLVSVALRLQVATKVVEKDEQTIFQLQNESMDSRSKLIIANKQAVEAQEMIATLNIEINTLKRKIKMLEGTDRNKTSGAETITSLVVQEADIEVEALLSNPIDSSQTANKKITATPFERWKLEQFLSTPDSHAIIQKQHDISIETLATNATLDSTQQFSKSKLLLFDRDSAIGKLRNLHTANEVDDLLPVSSHPSLIKLSKTTSKKSPYDSPHMIAYKQMKMKKDFFLEDDDLQMWGNRPKSQNLSHPNIWTSKSVSLINENNDQMHDKIHLPIDESQFTHARKLSTVAKNIVTKNMNSFLANQSTTLTSKSPPLSRIGTRGAQSPNIHEKVSANVLKSNAEAVRISQDEVMEQLNEMRLSSNRTTSKIII